MIVVCSKCLMYVVGRMYAVSNICSRVVGVTP